MFRNVEGASALELMPSTRAVFSFFAALPPQTDTMRTCFECGMEKQKDAFSKAQHKKHKDQSRCAICVALPQTGFVANPARHPSTLPGTASITSLVSDDASDTIIQVGVKAAVHKSPGLVVVRNTASPGIGMQDPTPPRDAPCGACGKSHNQHAMKCSNCKQV